MKEKNIEIRIVNEDNLRCWYIDNFCITKNKLKTKTEIEMGKFINSFNKNLYMCKSHYTYHNKEEIKILSETWR